MNRILNQKPCTALPKARALISGPTRRTTFTQGYHRLSGLQREAVKRNKKVRAQRKAGCACQDNLESRATSMQHDPQSRQSEAWNQKKSTPFANDTRALQLSTVACSRVCHTCFSDNLLHVLCPCFGRFSACVLQ